MPNVPLTTVTFSVVGWVCGATFDPAVHEMRAVNDLPGVIGSPSRIATFNVPPIGTEGVPAMAGAGMSIHCSAPGSVEDMEVAPDWAYAAPRADRLTAHAKARAGILIQGSSEQVVRSRNETVGIDHEEGERLADTAELIMNPVRPPGSTERRLGPSRISSARFRTWAPRHR